MNRWLLIPLFLLWGCAPEKATHPADSVGLSAQLANPQLEIGEPTELILSAWHPAGSSVRFPALEQDKKVLVNSAEQETTDRPNGGLDTELRQTISSLRPGDWSLGTNAVTVLFADGTQTNLAFPALTISVASAIGTNEVAQLCYVKPIEYPALSHWIWIALGVTLLVIVLGAALLYWLPKRALVVEQQTVPLEELARRALAHLKAKEWIPEPFFVELTFILRKYLEARFDLNAPDWTTEELSRELQKTDRLDLKAQAMLRRFFEQADLVKFAGASAEQAVMSAAFDSVETLVENTIQEEEAPCD